MNTKAKNLNKILFITITLFCVVGFCLLVFVNNKSQQPTANADYIVGETYTVHFDPNGGSGAMSDATEIYGEYTLPACSFVAPEGHRFDKWSVGDTKYSAGDKINVEADTNVLATWVLRQFNVIYNSNGGSGQMDNALVDYNASHTLNICLFTPPENKVFSGKWALNDPDGEKFMPGDHLQITNHIVLYAIWEDVTLQTYTINFDSNGGTGTMESIYDVQGGYTLPSCEFVPPTNKRFKCWDVLGTEQVPGATIQIYMNTTITAVWEDIPPTEYTIFFIANGGDGIMTNVKMPAGIYTLPNCTFTPPNGKQFKCWIFNGIEKQPGDQIAVSTSITLTADWKDLPPTVYTIKFSANGGSGTMPNVEMTAGTFTLPECTFTPPKGKQFKQWAIGNTKRAPGATIDIEQNITITAIWEKASTQPEQNNTEQTGLPIIVIALLALCGAAALGGAGFGIFKAIKHKKDTQYDWYKKDK